jgi:asparagine synthase (glutamine-hydrolysing)
MSGDAGDEFFAGYNRYTFLPTVWQTLGRMPRSLRKQMLNLAALAPNLVGELVGASQAADKIEKVKRLFATPANSIDDLYLATLSEWPNASSMVLGGFVPPNLLDVREDWPNILDPVARMMAIDGLTYLPDDILTKVDRASMAVSLETRAPFLDRDVMEFAWRLPMHMKLRGRTGKWILRQLLQRHLPPALVDRPKMGFSIPLDQWLRGPLRHWANDLLNENRLRREGYLRPDVISKTWNSHLSGEGNHGSRLWSILMFQAWLAEQSR